MEQTMLKNKSESNTFTMVDDRLINHYGKPNIALVYGSVERYAWKYGICWASQEQIGKRVGLKRGAVAGHLEALERDGFIINETPGRRNQSHRRKITGKINTLPTPDEATAGFRTLHPTLPPDITLNQKDAKDDLTNADEVDLQKSVSKKPLNEGSSESLETQNIEEQFISEQEKTAFGRYGQKYLELLEQRIKRNKDKKV